MSREQSEPSEDGDACVHTHPIPPGEVVRYSPNRDPEAEQDIVDYMAGQAPDETVHNVELIKTEHVLSDAYEMWDVATDKGRWWVITNATNLYSQAHFPSLDYTLSFHVGLMMRLRSRPRRGEDNEPDPFDEVFRRREQADERHVKAIEAEDYQAVGMYLRECLIALIGVMRRHLEVESADALPKAADFKNWADLFIGYLCPGEPNKDLRSYLKSCTDKTWSLVNWLTHHKGAAKKACSITVQAADTLIGHFVQLTSRKMSGDIEICPRCKSRNVRSHHDIDIPPDGAYFSSCGECGWDNHPNER